MPLPTLSETLGSARGIVAAGGNASLLADELNAENKAAQQQQQAANLAFRQQQEQQRQIEREQSLQQREQATAAKQAEQERKQSQRAEIAKAEFTKSTIGPLMTDAQRTKAESEVAKAMKSVRGVAAGTLTDATAKDPNANKTTGGFLGFGAKPTPEAQAVAERAQRAADPTLLNDEDLAQARALNPAPFDELDKKRAALDADAERRNKHQAATQQLARAKAIAAGVPEDELPTFGADNQQQPDVYQVAAQQGVLDRDTADITAHSAKLQRLDGDIQALRAKREELGQMLQRGVTGPQAIALHAQWRAMQTDEAARLAMLKDEESALKAKQRAFEAKRSMHQEQVAGLGAPARFTNDAPPTIAPEAARQAAKPVTDAQGAVVAHETSQPDSLESLAKSGSKAFWLDSSRSTAPTPDVREASTRAANDSVGVLTKFNEERASAHRDTVRQIADRVRRGELSQEEARAEEDGALAAYERAHESDLVAASQKLDNALRDFQEGRIDSDTLNTVFHAAGSAKNGVEAFKERLGELQKHQDASSKLVEIIVGDGSASDDPGLNGQALALANEVAQLKAEGSYGLAKDKQAELAQLRATHADKLRAELTKMGIDAGAHDAIIANAELQATSKVRPGVAANVAAKGGVGAWAAEKLPFVGGVIEAARLLPYAETASKLERGETPSKEELDQLNEFVRFSNQNPTFAAQAVEGLASLPGFAIELALTEGIANTVKLAGMKGLTTALKKMATSEGRELMSKALVKVAEKQGATNLGKRLVSGLAQEAVRLPIASAGRVAEKYMHDAATQGVTLTPDETNLVATIDRTSPNARKGSVARIADAVADTFIENLSERSGRWLGYAMPTAAKEALTKMAAPVKERLFKTALVRSLVSANPGVPVSTLSRVLAKANIGSTLSEMGEERVGDLARDLWKGVSTGQWGITVPTTEQLASEFVTFLVPGAKSALDVTRHFGKLDTQLQASDAQGTQHITLLSKPEDAAAHLSKALGTTIAPDEVKSARDLIGNVAGVDSVRDIDRAVESLMQKSNAAMQSGDLDRASKFRLMALEQSRTRARAADIDMLKAVSAVRQIADIRKQAATVQQHAAALAGDLSEARLSGEPINQNALQEQQVALQYAQALRTQADRASALVKIARGRDAMLTAQEQRALGDAVEYGPQGSIITDAARDELQQIAPAAADYIRQSETQRREELANVSARAVPAQSSAGAVTGNAAAVATDTATGSAEGVAEGGSPSAAPVASVAPAPVQELKPGVNHGKGEQFNADQWKANALAQVARSTDKPEARQHMIATIGATHGVLRSYGKIFEGGVLFAGNDIDGGMAFDTKHNALHINLLSLAANTRGLHGDELREFLDDRLNHEVIHVAANAVMTREQVIDIWRRLGKHDAGRELMKTVHRAYRAADEARNRPLKELSNFELGHELIRMMVQDKAFAHRISEAVAVDKGFLADLRDFLLKIADWLNMRIAALPRGDRATLEAHRDNVIEALRALGVLPVNAETAQGGENVMVSNDTVTPTGKLETPKEAAKPAAAKTQVDTKADKKKPDYSRYSEEQQALLRESDEQHAKDVANANSFTDDRDTQQKKLKAAGMRHAARFRQITGKLTAKERAAKDAYEASNHVGKAVSVDGVNGEIVGHAFGRVQVKLATGEVKTVDAEKIGKPAKSNAAQGDQSEGGVVSASGTSAESTASSSFGAVADAEPTIKQPEATSNEIGQGRDNAPGEEVVYQAPEDEAPATPPAPKATKPKAERRKKIMEAINPPDEARNNGFKASDAAIEKARKAFEGLGATERPTIEQTGLPRDRRAAFMDLADTLIEDGIKQPEELAAFLDRIQPDGRLRKFSQAMWNYLGTVSPELSGTHDWISIYATKKAEQAPEPEFSPSLGQWVIDAEGFMGPVIAVDENGAVTLEAEGGEEQTAKLPVKPTSAPADDTKPSQSITGSNVETPAAMPVPETGEASPVDQAAHEAATSPLNDRAEPTQAQKEAGNYKLGHLNISGLDISVENPAGSERKGTDKGGKAWSVTMADHYGYVKGTESRDGDHIDIFVEPGTPEDFAGPVFVVNQKDTYGEFDEHKAVLGPSITTAEQARAEYLKNYSPGWKGAGDVVKFDSATAFKAWATERQRRGAVRQETADKFAVNEAPVGEQQTALSSTDAPQVSEIDRRIADAEASGVVLSDADKAKIRKAFDNAEDAQKQANRLSGASSDPLNKGNSFPMGVGFTRMTKRTEQRIDASVKKAGEAVKFFNKAKLLRADVEALLAGKGTEADKAAKADKRKRYQAEVAAKLLTWKKGDKIASFTIERVNMDRDGYPSSYTISGEGIVKGVHDKVDVVKEIFGGDKQAFRKTIDEARVAQQETKDGAAAIADAPQALAAEVSTPEPVKESQPVKGPALTAQKKFLLEKIDDAIAGAKAKGRWIEKDGFVTIEVPGDGTFTIRDSETALREFKDMAKSFPTTVPKPDLPTATALRASGIPALAKGKVPPQDKVRVVGLFAAKDDDRPGIKFVADTGDAVVATDGRVLFFIEQPGEGSQEKPVFYKPTGGKIESEDRYPQWRQVAPKDARRVFSDIDTGRLWQIAKQASAVYKEAIREVKANNKVTITSPTPRIEFWKNADGSLGIATPGYTASEINGSYEHNVTPGAESIGVLDADYVMEVLRAMRALGNDSVNIGVAGTQTGRNTFTFDAGDAHAVVMEMAAPVDAPAQAVSPPDTSDEYKKAVAESRKASADFAEAERAYRARQIDDDAFLAAKALHDAASKQFDEAAAKEQKRLQQKSEPEPVSEPEATESQQQEAPQPGVLERAKAAGVKLPAKVVEGVKASDAKLTANAEKVVAQAEAKSTSGITDFGEKIGGARKDSSGPKTPRQPKAQKEVESQDPGWRKRYEVRQIVSSNKPGESGRWTITDLRTKDWTGQNRPATRETFATEEEANRMVPILAVARNHGVYSVNVGDGAPSGQAVANSTEANMKAINDLKEANRALLMSVDLTDRFKESLTKGELTQQRYDERLKDGTILNDADYAKGKTIADQIRVLQETPTPEMQAKETVTRYGIFRNVTDRKRVQVVQETFPTHTDAMKYMAANAETIIETKTSFGEEVLAKPEKVMREGIKRRDRPADAKMFQDTFGFRGVEFGNWLRQDGMAGNERQDVLNHAYDGLLDLAEVLNIPPKAISLNGDLALAFGARGHGLTGAKAHYERDYGVINLTKMAGAGSLAHEWFHALDHYLGRLDGKASAERVSNDAGNLAFQAKGRDGDYASHGFSYNSKAREELRRRYKDLLQSMFTKAEKFVEDTEKAEKFVGASRQHLADEIKGVRDDLVRQLDPKYYKRNNAPASKEQLEAFDTLAAKLLEGEDLATTHRYASPGDKPASSRGAMAGRFTNDTLEAMSAIFKTVRGRSGFQKEGSGIFDRIRGYMTRYAQRIAMLKSARDMETKEKWVPTDFAMNAKRIDQGRASDYWTTPHEMAARAFSAYVEDRLLEKGATSDFLSYGADNNLLGYRLLNIRPFPEGVERKAINELFDTFFGELKNRETDKGVELYATERPGLYADPEFAAAMEELTTPSEAPFVPLSDEAVTKVRSAARDKYGADFTAEEAAQVAANLNAGIAGAYQENRSRETHDAWIATAAKILQTDGLDSTADELLADPARLSFNPVKVKLAQMVADQLAQRALLQRSPADRDKAERLMWAYNVTGTQAGRAVAARDHVHASKEELHRRAIANKIFTPPAHKRADIEKAISLKEKNEQIAELEAKISGVRLELEKAVAEMTDRSVKNSEFMVALAGNLNKARAAANAQVAALNKQIADLRAQRDQSQLLAEANQARIAAIEADLARDFGLTLHDLFVSREALVRLRGSAIVKNALTGFNQKEALAQRLRMEGKSDRQIQKQTGISEKALADVFARVDEALTKQLEPWLDRGFSLGDFEQLDDQGNRIDPAKIIDDKGNLLGATLRAKITPEEKAARLKAILGAINSTAEARNTGALKRTARFGDGNNGFGFDLNRPEHAAMVARAIQRTDGNASDMIYEYWINGLLSGPATQTANIAGNTASMALEFAIQRPLEAMINATIFRDAAGAQLGEFRSMAKYASMIFATAVNRAKRAWQTEISTFDAERLDQPLVIRGGGSKNESEQFAIGGTPGRVIRTPSRLLNFADEFSKYLIGGLEAAAQAHRLAKANGLTGEEFDKFVASQVNTNGSQAWLAAVDKAHRLTFTSELPDMLKKANDMLRDRATTPGGAALKFFLRMVFPFVRTPYNIFATGLRKTPLGTLRMAGKATAGLVDSWKGTRPFFDSYPKAALAGDMAEQLVGWVAALVLAGMAEGDPDDERKHILITGTRSQNDSRGEAQLLNRTRGGETTILINGKPVFNYGRIEPFATVISTLVDAIREWKKVAGGEPPAKAIENATRALADQARSKTFLQGFDGLMQLFDGRTRSLPDAAVKAIVTGAVPNLVRQPLRNVDGFARDTRNAPWYYQALPLASLAEPLYDLYGRPIQKDFSPLARIALGSATTKVQPVQPADRALERWNKAHEGDPQQQYNPVHPSVFRFKDAQGKWQQMRPDVIARFRRDAGRAFAADAIAQFASPTAPAAEEVRGLRSVKDRSYDATKKNLLGAGVQPPKVARPMPTLAEVFGQRLR